MYTFGGYQGKENCKTPPAWILHPGTKYKISEKRGKPRTQPSEKSTKNYKTEVPNK